MALPWKQIIVYLPEVAKAARAAWNYWDGKPQPVIDPAQSVEAQLEAISKRIVALETNEKQQAEVVSQIADQLEGIALGLKETAARQAMALRLAVAAMIVAVGAVVVALFV